MTDVNNALENYKLSKLRRNLHEARAAAVAAAEEAPAGTPPAGDDPAAGRPAGAPGEDDD
jgi:hypothetical protein